MCSDGRDDGNVIVASLDVTLGDWQEGVGAGVGGGGTHGIFDCH